MKSNLGRGLRQQHLFEKGAEEQKAMEEAAAQSAIDAVARAEARELLAATVAHEVEEILSKRVESGKVYYRVKWLNYDSKDNSWEPVANLQGSTMLIAAFEEQIKSVKHPRVSIRQYTQSGLKRKRGGGGGRGRGGATSKRGKK